MADGSWASGIGPNIGIDTLRQFLALWQRVVNWEPAMGEADKVTWSWENNGKFSVRSAYAARFWGREVVPTA